MNILKKIKKLFKKPEYKEEKCFYCGKQLILYSSYNCKFCGKQYCNEHRLPEKHECLGLEMYKEKKLRREFKTE